MSKLRIVTCGTCGGVGALFGPWELKGRRRERRADECPTCSSWGVDVVGDPDGRELFRLLLGSVGLKDDRISISFWHECDDFGEPPYCSCKDGKPCEDRIYRDAWQAEQIEKCREMAEIALR